YFTQTLPINGEKEVVINVTLQRDVNNRDEWVEMGYWSQKRLSLTGAVSTVTGEELERAPVANLTQTLPGRLAGLITRETFSELSRATTQLYSRGVNSTRGNGPLA